MSAPAPSAPSTDSSRPVLLPAGAFRASRPLPFRETVLISSWYRSPSSTRDPELRLCFWLNSNHPGFTRRFWFVEERDLPDARAALARGEFSGELRVLPKAAGGRLRFGDAFRLASSLGRRLSEQSVFFLANSDIAIPASSAAALAALASAPRTAVCLSRHECELPAGAARRLVSELPRLSPAEVWPAVLRRTHLRDAKRCSRSQDVWVWHGSVRPSLARMDSLPLGTPGCDNAVAHHLGSDARLSLLNPCVSAKTYHIHASNVRTYTRADKVAPPYAGVPITLLPGDPGHPDKDGGAERRKRRRMEAEAARRAESVRAAASTKAGAPSSRAPSAATELQLPGPVFSRLRSSPLYRLPATSANRPGLTPPRRSGPVFLGYV